MVLHCREPPHRARRRHCAAVVRWATNRGSTPTARQDLHYLRDQFFDECIAEGTEVLRNHDERAGATDDVVAVVVCKPTQRVSVPVSVLRICGRLRLTQDDEPVDRDALSDRLVARIGDIATAVVIAVPETSMVRRRAT
jgi:hypothetical protein